MKKIIFGTIAIIAIAVVVAFNIQLNSIINGKMSSISLANVEVLAYGDTPPKQVYYDKKKGNCTKTFTIDTDLTVTIRGIKIPVKGIAGGSYSATYTDVQIDCPLGSQYLSCKECSCSDFWANLC